MWRHTPQRRPIGLMGKSAGPFPVHANLLDKSSVAQCLDGMAVWRGSLRFPQNSYYCHFKPGGKKSDLLFNLLISGKTTGGPVIISTDSPGSITTGLCATNGLFAA